MISRLLRDRILLLGSQVDDEVANVLVAQLLYLANEDSKTDMTLSKLALTLVHRSRELFDEFSN